MGSDYQGAVLPEKLLERRSSNGAGFIVALALLRVVVVRGGAGRRSGRRGRGSSRRCRAAFAAFEGQAVAVDVAAGDVADTEVEELYCGVVVGEVAAVIDDLAELEVDGLRWLSGASKRCPPCWARGGWVPGFCLVDVIILVARRQRVDHRRPLPRTYRAADDKSLGGCPVPGLSCVGGGCVRRSQPARDDDGPRPGLRSRRECER